MATIPPFHLAFPVHSITAARDFYGGLLQCPEGRSDTHWVDFNLFGHQIVAHYSPEARSVVSSSGESESGELHHNPVDGHQVPVPHFGVVLPWETWQALADRLSSHGIQFVIAPYIRFQGQPGEQATMFFLDPSGNALEFKAFRDLNDLFRRD